MKGELELMVQDRHMLQEVMVSPGKIEFYTKDIPVPGKSDVLIRIRRLGICGSDIHVYHGTHPFTGYPVTQGHEVCGEIVETGEAVSQLKKGQKVTIEPQVYCEKCYPCRHGKYNLCENLKVMGFQTTGAASEYFMVDESKVTVLPDEISFDEGAMIEPLAVAVHAIKRFGNISGKKVIVLGAGTIGNLVAQTAKGLGAKKVLITDVSDLRLKKAQECGIEYAVNTKREDFEQAVHAAFGPDKADVIYDCAGNNITINQAIRHTRKGSTIILVAVFQDMAEVDLAVLNDHELDLNTSMMYRHEDYVDAINLVKNKSVRLDPLISKHFSFREMLDAYQYIDENKESTLKVLIDIEDLS